MEVLSEVCFSIVLAPVSLLEFFYYSPFSAQFLLPPSQVFLIARDVVICHARRLSTTFVDSRQVQECPPEIRRGQLALL